jgi:hypothetical protein
VVFVTGYDDPDTLERITNRYQVLLITKAALS